MTPEMQVINHLLYWTILQAFAQVYSFQDFLGKSLYLLKNIGV